MKAKFEFTDVPADLPASSIVIRDLIAPGNPSIAEDARAVVQTLLRIAGRMEDPVGYNMPPIYYYDSNGVLMQLEHDGIEWIGGNVEAQEIVSNGGN